MESKTRDLYLDFYRGIAAISVIFIHTVYFSGEIYLADNSIFFTLALLIDVPLFVFLSGWSAFYTASIKKTFDNVLKTWGQYIIFIVVVDIVCNVIWHGENFPVQEFLSQIVFTGNTPYLPVIAGSLWFMRMWIPVVLTGSALTVLLQRLMSKSDIYIRIVTFFLISIVWFSITNQDNYFVLNRYFCFYAVFFLVGYFMADHWFNGKFWQYLVICAMIIFLWFLTSRIFQMPARNLQSAKFPPHLMYFIASLLSVVTVVYFRGKIDPVVERCHVLRFVGKNALSFYFAQGIGSSILFHIYRYFLSHGPYLTLVICFAANVMITLICGIGLIQVYRGVFWISGYVERYLVSRLQNWLGTRQS